MLLYIFINPFDFQFLPLGQADNIVLMAHDDEQGGHDAEDDDFHGFAEEKHRYGHKKRSDDRTKRYEAGNAHDDCPDEKYDERFPRCQEQYDTQASSNALASLEMEEQGTVMAQDGQKAAGNHGVDAQARQVCSGKLPQVYTQEALAHVEYEDDRAGLGPEDAVGICCADVMAAVIAQVQVEKGFADDQAARERAHDIGCQ